MTKTKENNNKINKNRREVSEKEWGFIDFLLSPN
jgi:hypothetical protein